jgi:hypothetical protein
MESELQVHHHESAPAGYPRPLLARAPELRTRFQQHGSCSLLPPQGVEKFNLPRPSPHPWPAPKHIFERNRRRGRLSSAVWFQCSRVQDPWGLHSAFRSPVSGLGSFSLAAPKFKPLPGGPLWGLWGLGTELFGQRSKYQPSNELPPNQLSRGISRLISRALFADAAAVLAILCKKQTRDSKTRKYLLHEATTLLGYVLRRLARPVVY